MKKEKSILAKGLFFKDESIAIIKKRIKQDKFQYIWQDIISTADRMVAEGSLAWSDDTFTIYYYTRKRLMDLAMAAIITKDTRYISTLKKILRKLSSRDLNFWIGPEYPNRPRYQIYKGEKISTGELETATLATGMAVAYDWTYGLLDKDDRDIIIECLRDKAYLLLKNSTMFQSEKWVMNHLCVIASALTVVLLILKDEKGIDFKKDLKLIKKALGLWMRTMDNDGSYGEGYHYWAYPVNCLFFAIHSLKQLHNIDLPEINCLKNSFEWALYNQVGKYSFGQFDNPVSVAVNTYDSPYLFQMEAPEVLLYSSYFKNPLARWYIDNFLLTKISRPDALHTVWHECNSLLLPLYDEEQKSSSPSDLCLGSSRVFHDTGFVYLRDSWQGLDKVDGKQTVFSLLSGGGGKANSHQHYDKNSFSLFARGEYWIVDPGHSCYRGEKHKKYDTRTLSHNTLAIDGKNQQLDFVERGMEHSERKQYTSHHNRAEVVCKRLYKEIEYVASEGKRCYQPYLNQYLRQVWYVKPEYFLIKDRIDLGEHHGNIISGFNLNNIDGKLEYKLDDGKLMASRPESDLFIQVIAPSGMGFKVEEGILHYAYHILPDQDVEGEIGSAIRFNFDIEKGVETLELVYIIVPMEKGKDVPEVNVVDFYKNKRDMLEKLHVKINHNQKDSFNIGDDMIFSRNDKQYYRF